MENDIQVQGSDRKVRRRFTSEQIEEYLATQGRSGLSVAEFCQQQGLTPSVFYGWRRRLMEEEQPEPRFREVSLPRLLNSAWVAEIALPTGAVIRLSAAAGVEHWRGWLTELLLS